MKVYNGQGESVDITAQVDTFDIPIITGVCPHVYITCNTDLPDLGSSNVKGTITFMDGKTKFSLYAKMKAQGDQSLSYDQKQINATLYKDAGCTVKQKVRFNDWMSLSKFHIKSHPQDTLQSKNAVVASMLQKLMGTRLPNGAWGFIKAFPVIVHWNDYTAGCYCWTTPQDGKIFNFSDFAELDCTNLAYRFSGEYRGDEDENADMIAAKDAIFAIVNDTENLTKSIIEEHFDVTSILQMICAVEWFAMADCVPDNSLMVTWDGEKWYTLPYDFDWSLRADNRKLINDTANYLPITFLRKCELLYSTEIKAVYANMRKNGMDVDNAMHNLTEFLRHWNYQDRLDEFERWQDLPSHVAEDLSAVRTAVTNRCAYVDSIYEYTE